jgi:plasmid maintenance system antidote protein VapI
MRLVFVCLDLGEMLLTEFLAPMSLTQKQLFE